MKKKLIIFIFLFLAVVLFVQSFAQFTPEELANREKWEEFLMTAEITGHRETRGGVTKPLQLFLKEGDVEASGCWKNPKGMMQGYLEGWQYEIAAYRMDKLLELNMIGPTVEREFEGKKGSLQLWVGEMNDLERMEREIPIPQPYLDRWEKQKYLMRAFDSLISNEDRTQENIRYTKDWRMILIDHSRSFRSSKKFTGQLVYGKNGLLGAKHFRQLPRAFVEKIKTLDFKTIKKAVDPYLENKEIQAIMTRKILLLAEIEGMIKENGEAEVLY